MRLLDCVATQGHDMAQARALGAKGGALGARHRGEQACGTARRGRARAALRHGQGLGDDTALGWPRHGH